MADFCRQCSEELFGKDHRDLAGQVTEEQVKEGLAANVLCEGCGFTQVDHNGQCLGNCDNPKHEQKEQQ